LYELGSIDRATTRALSSGPYQGTFIATDAAGSCRPRTITFTILSDTT
jgi:hypothetical protein